MQRNTLRYCASFLVQIHTPACLGGLAPLLRGPIARNKGRLDHRCYRTVTVVVFEELFPALSEQAMAMVYTRPVSAVDAPTFTPTGPVICQVPPDG